MVLGDIPVLLTRNVDALSASVESVHSENDLVDFVCKYKSGKEIPDPYEFEPYQQGLQQPKKLKFKRATTFAVTSFFYFIFFFLKKKKLKIL